MIRLSQSCLDEAEQEAVLRVLEKGFLGMGQEVKLFETELSEFIGNDVEVSCVNTGTSALQLALQAIGCGAGDEVLVPTLTYVASFQAISATGATPVACDVNLNTGFIDLEDASQRLTSKTKAIMPVHYGSYVLGMPDVYHFARANDIRVVEDAAHSFGCYLEGKKIGSFGDITCFSFDGIKNITSGEGGAIVTKDKVVIDKINDIRLLGVEGDTRKRFTNSRSWTFDVTEQGWRYHMSDLMAAIGRAQLKKIDLFSSARKNLANEYRNRFKDSIDIELFEFDEIGQTPHIFSCRALVQRDELREHLMAKSIQTGLHYQPNHMLNKFSDGQSRPAAELLFDQIISFPLHPDLSVENVHQIMDVTFDFLNNCS